MDGMPADRTGASSGGAPHQAAVAGGLTPASFGRLLGERLDEVRRAAHARASVHLEAPRRQLGFLAGARRLRDAITRLKFALDETSAAWVALEPALQDVTGARARAAADAICAPAGRLLEWDAELSRVCFRKGHHALHNQIRWLGHTYFDRLRQAADLLAQGGLQPGDVGAAGLAFPGWLVDAHRGIAARVRRLTIAPALAALLLCAGLAGAFWAIDGPRPAAGGDTAGPTNAAAASSHASAPWFQRGAGAAVDGAGARDLLRRDR